MGPSECETVTFQESVMPTEGAVRFSYRWIGLRPLPEREWHDLGEWRQKLAALSVLGVNAAGVAFGNLSQRRAGTNHFIITGTQTSGLRRLDGRHFTEVINSDLERHALSCRGPVLPSSEALSHAAVYQGDARVCACLHVHHARLWRTLYSRVPTTSSDGECGSLRMARDILRLLRESRQEPRIIVMGGHPDGLLFLGESLDDAGRRLVDRLRRL